MVSRVVKALTSQIDEDDVFSVSVTVFKFKHEVNEYFRRKEVYRVLSKLPVKYIGKFFTKLSSAVTIYVHTIIRIFLNFIIIFVCYHVACNIRKVFQLPKCSFLLGSQVRSTPFYRPTICVCNAGAFFPAISSLPISLRQVILQFSQMNHNIFLPLRTLLHHS